LRGTDIFLLKNSSCSPRRAPKGPDKTHIFKNIRLMQKQVIILFGAPGAGKGTQATLLSEKLDFFYFETSGIIERIIKDAKEEFIEEDGEKFYFAEQKRLWENGKLWDPPFVVHFAKEKIKELANEGKSILFAGSPRTIYEAQKELPLLKELYGAENIKVFLIEISPQETLHRNSNRKICELMRHPIIFNDETKNLTLCPLDGSKLEKREGLDNPETIKVRLEEYKNRTVPIFDIIEKEGIQIKKINGEQSVAGVYNDILSKISDKD